MVGNERKPRFIREESWRYKRVKASWRRPRGKSSRVRQNIKGWPPRVKVGYGTAASIRALHPSGLREILINRPEDLASINPKEQAARIAHSVGERKRLLIMEEAKKKQIKIINPRLRKTAEETPAPVEETERAVEAGNEGGGEATTSTSMKEEQP